MDRRLDQRSEKTIGRLDTAVDKSQTETRETASSLEAERRAHDKMRAEARESQVMAEEREKRIISQEENLRELRRQMEIAGGKNARLDADLAHANTDELRVLLKQIQNPAQNRRKTTAKKTTTEPNDPE